MALHPRNDEEKVADLIRRLQSADPRARLNAATVLGRMGPRALEAAPALVAALRDDNVHLRKMAALALGDLGAVEAVPPLIEALRDPDAAVRRRAAVALGELGPWAQGALPALRLALQDADEGVRRAATHALQEIVQVAPGQSRAA